MSERGGRESIWSISKDDLKIYSILFPCIWLVETIFYTWKIVPWDKGWVEVIGELILNVGILGVSSAVLSMMVLAGWRFGMVLFDWPSKVKREREKALKTGYETATNDLLSALKNNSAIKKAIDSGELQLPLKMRELLEKD